MAKVNIYHKASGEVLSLEPIDAKETLQFNSSEYSSEPVVKNKPGPKPKQKQAQDLDVDEDN